MPSAGKLAHRPPTLGHRGWIVDRERSPQAQVFEHLALVSGSLVRLGAAVALLEKQITVGGEGFENERLPHSQLRFSAVGF